MHNRVLAEKHTDLARAYMQLAMNHQRLAILLNDIQTDTDRSAIIQMLMQEQIALSETCAKAKLELHNYMWSQQKDKRTTHVPIKVGCRIF